jgi:hypothetical protein
MSERSARRLNQIGKHGAISPRASAFSGFAFFPGLPGPPLAADLAVDEPSSTDLLFTAAFLVRDNIEPFRQRVHELAAERRDLRFLCTGPWPPYHFVPSINDVAAPAPETTHA